MNVPVCILRACFVTRLSMWLGACMFVFVCTGGGCVCECVCVCVCVCVCARAGKVIPLMGATAVQGVARLVVSATWEAPGRDVCASAAASTSTLNTPPPTESTLFWFMCRLLTTVQTLIMFMFKVFLHAATEKVSDFGSCCLISKEWTKIYKTLLHKQWIVNKWSHDVIVRLRLFLKFPLARSPLFPSQLTLLTFEQATPVAPQCRCIRYIFYRRSYASRLTFRLWMQVVN